MTHILQTTRRFLAPAAVLLAATAAHAAPTPTVRTLDVEVTDAAKGATDVTRFLLAFDGTKASHISLPIGDLGYHVSARCDLLANGALPITVGVHRTDNRPGSPAKIDVDLAVAIPVGVRTVIANAVRPDGSRIEVAIRAH